MKERPILFSAPMVRALLDGRKTQTRRIVKPQPDWLPEVGYTRRTDGMFWPIGSLGQQCGAPLVKCPYGLPGDGLWVREAWKAHSTFEGTSPRDIPRSTIFYMADDAYAPSGSRGRPGIHMPRWASRLFLRITDVRVERLQAISPEDALAEGVYPGEQPPVTFNRVFSSSMPVHLYGGLWEHLNGAGSWGANPWVWAVTFERI